jgi:hypothetical protein
MDAQHESLGHEKARAIHAL